MHTNVTKKFPVIDDALIENHDNRRMAETEWQKWRHSLKKTTLFLTETVKMTSSPKTVDVLCPTSATDSKELQQLASNQR